MERIRWTPDLETGIAFVDGDHRILLRLINQVNACVRQHEESGVVGSVLNSLYDYTHYHFKREEKLQELAGYAGLEAHRQGHARLSAEVEGLRDDYRRDPLSFDFARLRMFLATWLSQHIRADDMDFAAACAGNAQAIAAAAAARIVDDMPGAARAPAHWEDLSVLVVEDNPNFRELMSTLLNASGIRRISAVADALTALDRLALRPYDIVLCDMIMDGMDGPTFVRSALEANPRTRIVLVSGLDRATLGERAAELAVDAWIEKPLTPAALFQAMSACMASGGGG